MVFWSVSLFCYHNHFTALFPDHPGDPVPEKNFWTLWCKGRLTETVTPTIRLGATPSGQTNAHLQHPPHYLQARFPSCHPSNSVKALKATSAFGLWRRRWSLLSGVTCTVSTPEYKSIIASHGLEAVLRY